MPSLALPDVQHLPPPEALAQVEAVRLFVERALAVQPHFALTAQNAAVVAQVCRRLDGIPLALELAAARLRGLSIEHLAARLDQRFRLLTGGSRAALAAPADAASHGGLELRPAERGRADPVQPAGRIRRRLHPGGGGGGLRRRADRNGGGAGPAPAAGGQVAGGGRGAVQATSNATGCWRRCASMGANGCWPRARPRTSTRGTSPIIGRWPRRPRVGCTARSVMTWIDLLDAEQMNLRQALGWALDVGAAQEGLRLAAALAEYWHLRGYMAEGEQWLAELLALPEAVSRTTVRARALTAIASMRRSIRMLDGSQTVGAETEALVAEAISIAREAPDKATLSFALYLLGGWIARQDYAAGRAMLEENLVLCCELDLQPFVAATIHRLGDVAWEQGDTEAAGTWWSEALDLTRQAGFQEGIAATLGDLGMMAFHEGDYDTARDYIVESLVLYRAQHVHHLVALALGCLGAVARAQGDTTLARTCYEEKLAFWRDIGNRTGIAATLAEMGALALQEGDHVQAHALFQEAITLRRELRDRAGEAASLAHLGDLAYAQGDHWRAATLYREGLNLVRATGDRAVAAICLEGLAAVALAGGQPERAARFYGADATQRRGTFVLNVWDDRVARDRQIDAVRAALGEEAFAAAWAAGQAMTLNKITRQEFFPTSCTDASHSDLCRSIETLIGLSPVR